MKWFKFGYSVCSKCGVHYDKVIGSDARWGNLCPIHRKPAKELDLRKDAVISWAEANFERLGEIMDKEKEAAIKAYEENYAIMRNQCNQGISNLFSK